MPDVVTHATFALDVCEKLEINNLKEMLTNHKYIYFLGAQGPDVFYFFKLFSMKKDSQFSNFGNVMHDFKASEFLIESIKYLKKQYSEDLYSYICGFICHHALDRNVHPYVYYVTGNDKIKYRGNHVRLERAIDSWFIMNRWNEPTPHYFKIHEKILKYELNKNIFGPFYDNILNNVYQVNNGGNAFINSAKNFRRYGKMLFDRYGLKKKFARFIDIYFNKKSKLVLETLFYYKNIDNSIDYMNLKKIEWFHPVLNDRSSTYSFLDLYHKGINEAIDEIITINSYLGNRITENELKEKIKDLSYSTGLECNENNEMKYFNVIF